MFIELTIKRLVDDVKTNKKNIFKGLVCLQNCQKMEEI